VELKQIKELMAAMGRSGTKRLKISNNGFELELEQQNHFQPPLEPNHSEANNEAHPPQSLVLKRPAPVLPKASEHPTPRSEGDHVEVEGNFITSPMVGTFYASPSPEDAAFVKVGDKVEKNSIVCIIEAMKVMNEIKAGATGTVAEILVESGHSVEFGTKLFKIV